MNFHLKICHRIPLKLKSVGRFVVENDRVLSDFEWLIRVIGDCGVISNRLFYPVEARKN